MVILVWAVNLEKQISVGVELIVTLTTSTPFFRPLIFYPLMDSL